MKGKRRGTFTLEPYNSEWPEMFLREKGTIKSLLEGEVLRIEHIGSTSVIGLGAKPIIDLCAEFKDLESAGKAVAALEKFGYELSPSDSTSERYFLRKGAPTQFQLSLTEAGSWYSRRTKAFRDYLNSHSQERDAYNLLKWNLSSADPEFGRAYTDGKTEFVTRVLRLANCFPDAS